MNQDRVKELLLDIDSNVDDFSVIFTGKESAKIDGLYNRETCEILIHNRNFNNDNSMIYTAIHEFAHHIDFNENGKTEGNNHTVEFWLIFNNLLKVAERKGLYENIFKSDPKFKLLTQEIKDHYLKHNGELMKDFGKRLVEAYDLCQRSHAEFEDYVDRELSMNRTLAKSIMKVYAMDVDPEIGFDNMKVVSNVKDHHVRKEVEELFKNGASPNEVKKKISESSPEPNVTVKKLEAEKARVEKTIHSLNIKLHDIEIKIDEYGN